jgi:hypothetical protein
MAKKRSHATPMLVDVAIWLLTWSCAMDMISGYLKSKFPQFSPIVLGA